MTDPRAKSRARRAAARSEPASGEGASDSAEPPKAGKGGRRSAAGVPLRAYRGGARGAGTLGFPLGDTADVLARVRCGFAYEAVVRLREGLDLPLDALAACVGIPARTLARRREEGRLRPDESERVLRLARLLDLAIQLFEGDAEAARRWLRGPRKALGGETALDYARTEVGAREVERLIGQLEHGVQP